MFGCSLLDRDGPFFCALGADKINATHNTLITDEDAALPVNQLGNFIFSFQAERAVRQSCGLGTWGCCNNIRHVADSELRFPGCAYSSRQGYPDNQKRQLVFGLPVLNVRGAV